MERTALSFFVYYYKSMLLFYSKWREMSIEDIQAKKKNLYLKFKSKNADLDNLSPYTAENRSLSDLRINSSIDALMDREEEMMHEAQCKGNF